MVSVGCRIGRESAFTLMCLKNTNIMEIVFSSFRDVLKVLRNKKVQHSITAGHCVEIVLSITFDMYINDNLVLTLFHPGEKRCWTMLGGCVQ